MAEIVWSADGPMVAAIDGQPPADARTEVVWAGREAFLLQDGAQARVAFPDPLARNSDAAASGGEVTAPMHGRIVAVAVSPGGRVRKGDLLFTLEAMKMEHSVAAPLAGTVRAVRIAPGAQVEQGAPAVSIDPDEGAAPDV
jgi:3-methylcrotonyl-CoA carboxylase alpha subunit